MWELELGIVQDVGICFYVFSSHQLVFSFQTRAHVPKGETRDSRSRVRVLAVDGCMETAL